MSALLTNATPLGRIPRELLLLITELLDPESYISLAMLHYPLFARRGLVPVLTTARVKAILSGPSEFPLQLLPPEILLQVMRRLPREDMMAFVVADYRHLADVGIAPRLTDQVVRGLWLACPLECGDFLPRT